MPTSCERRLIGRQLSAIRDADVVTALFPCSAEAIEKECPGSCVQWICLPANVPVGVEPCFDRFRRKLLFIGNRAYIPGLKVIASAVREFNALNPSSPFDLDVIGIDSESAGLTDPFVTCHGYLRKDVDGEKDLYYSLLRSAAALVAVSRTWVGASSVVEAMALGTPVIVSPNIELERMIGDMDCGRWCEPTAEGVLASLEYLSEMDDAGYTRMCRSAYEKAREWTWDAFVERWCSSVGL